MKKIEVRPPGDFPGHRPVQVTLEIPADLPKKIRWRQPKPFFELRPDSELLAHHYVQHRPDFVHQSLGETDLFHQWAKHVERAVDATLADMHARDPIAQPFAGLPKGYVGRCHHKPQKAQQWPSMLPKAWNGQFDTLQNCVSHQLRSRIKQLRRIQSLVHRVRKSHTHQRSARMPRFDDLQLEWEAILKAPGFQPAFVNWVGAIPEIQYVPSYLPSLEYLVVLEQFLRFDVEAQDAAETRHFRRTQKYHQWYDHKHGHDKQSFQSVRDPGLPPVTYVDVTQHEDATVTQALSGLWTLHTEKSLPLALGQSCRFHDVEVEVCHIAPNQITVMPLDDPFPPVSHGKLAWDESRLKPQQIAFELESYWNQFWQRDEATDLADDHTWQEFHAILATLPSFEACPIDDLCLDAWKEAIRHMPSRSAAGICGWVPDDLKCLPEVIIQDLAQVFRRYQDTHLPIWMLQAKTVPFRKSKQFAQSAFTRPITIMSMLYRLWGRVVTQQITKFWSQKFSSAITGFLPGRSAAQAAWKLQWKLEQTLQNPCSKGLGGLTLDLIKAFNTLPRNPSRSALQHYGVPTTLAQHWFHNLGHVQRHWQIHGSLIPGDFSTTGAPEGDAWSVVIMLSLGHVWAELLAPEVAPTVFADNLGWHCSRPQAHRAALDHTLSFVQALKLSIDWRKTLVWGSHDSHRQAWQTLRSQYTSLVEVPLEGNASDLGYQMHYRLQHSRTVPKKRHADAIRMLERLEYRARDLDITAKIITCAIWPRALFGCHLIGLGDWHFRTLRTAATRCMVTGQGQPNPYLATTILSKHSIDPLQYALKESLRVARDVLIWLPHEDQLAFYRMVVTHSKRAIKVHGPAGALAYYLDSHDLHMTLDGKIVRTAMAEIHILCTPWPDIQTWVQQAWFYKLPSLLSTRKDWHALPVIDIQQQHRLFHALPHKQRLQLAKDLTGAYLTNERKGKFDDAQTEMCSFCDLPDSTRHRVLECPQFASIRQDFPEVLQFLDDYDDCYVELPLCYMSGGIEINEWLQHKTTPFQWPELTDPSEQDLIFTDGSCKFPELPHARSATYAIVKVTGDGRAPDDFQILGSAECRGKQSINRAELIALQEVACTIAAGTVVTDSQYGLSVVHRCLATPDVRLLHRMSNYDIVEKLWYGLQDSALRFAKVKSHQSLLDATTCQEALLIRGNALADATAQAARDRYRQLNPCYTDADDDLMLLHSIKAVWEYRYAVLKQRSILQQALDATDKPLAPGQTPQHIVKRLLTYSPVSVDAPKLHIPDELLRWSLWGTAYAYSLHEWMGKLVWPDQGAEQEETAVGVSWLELTLSYIWDQGRLPCVNLGGVGKRMKPCMHNLDDPPIAGDVPFLQVTRNFRQAIDHLLKGTTCHPPQWKQRSRVVSHYLFGAQACAQGLKSRPWLPCQAQVVQMLQEYFKNPSNSYTWHNWPFLQNIPVGNLTLHEEDELDYVIRYRFYREAVHGH